MENVLCQREEQVVVSALFEEVAGLLQDCDDSTEKEKIKKVLQELNHTTSYIVLGESQVGKTTLMQVVFQDIFDMPDEMAGDVCEYRYGEREVVTPLLDGSQKHFIPNEDLKGISIIDTKGVNQVHKDTLEKISKLVENCGAAFIVLEAARINSASLWDVIENYPQRRMVFFLTKCDLLSKEELEVNMEKLKVYMSEAGISAPIFPVSVCQEVEWAASVHEVHSYIREQIIGVNPILNKQKQNIEDVRDLLIGLNKSFALRKKQYLSDMEILEKINTSLDSYVANHKLIMEEFIGKLTIAVNKDIDSYQNEIISKMDPYKIKERFRTKEDFMDYLNMVNDNYKNMMSDSINKKTMDAIRSCMHDLEIVFNEAAGYFNKRENILELNDRFYGSLSTSRKQMVSETRNTIEAAGEFYMTLSDASEELFMQVWRAREEYNNNIHARKVLSVIGGGALGALSGSAGTAAFYSFLIKTVGLKAIEAMGLAVVGGTLFVAIGVIGGALILNSIAKALYDPKAATKMEETTQKCIVQFKEEVEHTRVMMLEQISSQIKELFEKELISVDSCFTDFRMAVNIDEKKIPLLEAKMAEIEGLLQKIDNM